MYDFLFIAYVLLGTAIAAALFIWALRSGQFKDQQRARFLPLAAEAARDGAERPKGSRRRRLFYGIIAVLAAGSAVAVIVWMYAARHSS